MPNCGIQTFELCREERPGGRLKLVAGEDAAPDDAAGNAHHMEHAVADESDDPLP
jgi:hypothetical protein